MANGELWTDPEFGPDDIALWEGAPKIEGIVWKRPKVRYYNINRPGVHFKAYGLGTKRKTLSAYPSRLHIQISEHSHIPGKCY